jgi:hypothetical protein
MSALPILKVADRIVDPDKPFLTKGLLKDKLKIWGDKMVNKTKETSSTTWAAPVLLTLLLGYNIYNNQTSSTRITAQDIQLAQQHDLLIELKTLKEVEDKAKVEERTNKKLEDDLARAYREQMTKSMNRLELVVQGRYPNNSNNNSNQ